MKNTILFIILYCICNICYAQDELNTLPYHEIPDYPEEFSDLNIAARMIDGLGFRYYWATENLRQEDLDFDPGNDGQTCEEVLEHLFGLSNFIISVVKGNEIGQNQEEDMSWEKRRRRTLENFYTASQLLKSGKLDLKTTNIVFRRGEKTSEFPFWNLINGPIADAIYHTGQITSYRRSSGNPIDPNISVFSGKKRG